MRVFGLTDEIRQRYVLDAERRSAWISVGRQMIFAVGYLGAIGFVLWRAVNGAATAGDVVAAGYLCQRVATTVVWPIFSLARLGAIMRAAKRILWLRDYADTVTVRHSDEQ